ncbi:unnamed protein product, partial [Ostreobium quekettii]
SSNSVDMRDCIFKGNKAHGFGAALRVQESTTLDMAECTFEGNQANGDGRGGGLALAESVDVRIQESIFSSNSADFGGAIDSLIQVKLTVDGSKFSNNTAGNSGGAYNAANESTTDFNSCDFFENNAGIGGAIATYARCLRGSEKAGG